MLYVGALRICEQQVGYGQLETASVLHDFAVFQQVQGRTQDAVVLYQRALTIREQVLGSDYPMTTDTCERLHAVLNALGQSQEAARVEAAHKEEIAAARNQVLEE